MPPTAACDKAKLPPAPPHPCKFGTRPKRPESGPSPVPQELIATLRMRMRLPNFDARVELEHGRIPTPREALTMMERQTGPYLFTNRVRAENRPELA